MDGVATDVHLVARGYARGLRFFNRSRVSKVRATGFGLLRATEKGQRKAEEIASSLRSSQRQRAGLAAASVLVATASLASLRAQCGKLPVGTFEPE